MGLIGFSDAANKQPNHPLLCEGAFGVDRAFTGLGFIGLIGFMGFIEFIGLIGLVGFIGCLG